MERALYYPYFHVRDSRWLKTAALYWPGLAQVSPPDYRSVTASRAHPDVRLLADELDFFTPLDPAPVIAAAGQRFVEMTARHGSALRAGLYGSDSGMPEDWIQALDHQRAFASIRHEFQGTSDGSALHVRGLPGVPAAAIHAGIVSQPAIEALTDAGLAVPYRGAHHHAAEWVTMPAGLVSLVSSVVAEELAKRNGLGLATDQLEAFNDTADASADQLAALLLGTAVAPPGPGSDSVMDRIRMLTVRLAIPVDLDRVTMQQIVNVRSKFGEEFATYYAAVEESANDLRERITPETDAALVDTYVNHVLVSRFRTPQANLKKRLRACGLESGLTTLGVQVPAPLAAVAAGADPTVQSAVVVAGLGVAAIGWALTNRRRRDEAAQGNPTSYLIQAERNLNARWLLTRLTRRAGRLTGTV